MNADPAKKEQILKALHQTNWEQVKLAYLDEINALVNQARIDRKNIMSKDNDTSAPYVANLEVCKELFELSGGSKTLDSWHDTYFAWAEANVGDKKWEYKVIKNTFQALNEYIPAYDLGYLIRKLPKTTGNHFLSVFPRHKWYAEYSATFGANTDSKLYQGVADTPEDAACLLAIKLFKEGVLK